MSSNTPRYVLAATLCLSLCAAAQHAHANDGAFGGAGGSLVPRKNEHVAMRAEDITLEVVKSTAKGRARGALEWKVEALYTFENTSQKEVHVKVGFPEFSCGGDSPCDEDHPYSFHDLETTVRGKPITHTVGKLSAHSKGWGDELARVHLFDVTFEPGETLTITHSYRHELSDTAEGVSVEYVTRTGALWAGPIGSARFTIKTPWPHRYVAFPEEYELLARREALALDPASAQMKTVWTHVFEMKDWTPKQDLYVLFGNDAERGPKQCEGLSRVTWHYDDAMKRYAEQIPDKTERTAMVEQELVEAYFSKLDDEALRQCRNWPYALHGYRFKDEALYDYFYARPFSTHCPFCEATSRDTFIDEDNPERYTRFFHMPNPDYTPKLLSNKDLLYIRLAKMAQAARSKKK